MNILIPFVFCFVLQTVVPSASESFNVGDWSSNLVDYGIQFDLLSTIDINITAIDFSYNACNPGKYIPFGLYTKVGTHIDYENATSDWSLVCNGTIYCTSYNPSATTSNNTDSCTITVAANTTQAIYIHGDTTRDLGAYWDSNITIGDFWDTDDYNQITVYVGTVMLAPWITYDSSYTTYKPRAPVLTLHYSPCSAGTSSSFMPATSVLTDSDSDDDDDKTLESRSVIIGDDYSSESMVTLVEYGIQFDLITSGKQDVFITEIEFNYNACDYPGKYIPFGLYSREGSHVGYQESKDDWELICNGTVYCLGYNWSGSSGTSNVSSTSGSSSYNYKSIYECGIYIPGNSTKGIYLHGGMSRDLAAKWDANLTIGDEWDGDEYLTSYVGTAVSSPWMASTGVYRAQTPWLEIHYVVEIDDNDATTDVSTTSESLESTNVDDPDLGSISGVAWVGNCQSLIARYITFLMMIIALGYNYS